MAPLLLVSGGALQHPVAADASLGHAELLFPHPVPITAGPAAAGPAAADPAPRQLYPALADALPPPPSVAGELKGWA